MYPGSFACFQPVSILYFYYLFQHDNAESILTWIDSTDDDWNGLRERDCVETILWTNPWLHNQFFFNTSEIYCVLVYLLPNFSIPFFRSLPMNLRLELMIFYLLIYLCWILFFFKKNVVMNAAHSSHKLAKY